MKNNQNISPLNGVIRIALGFTLLSWAIAQLARKRHVNYSYLFVALCAATKIGSGILRYCPFTSIGKQCMSITTHDVCISPIKELLKDMIDKEDKENKEEEETLPNNEEAINPS